MRAPPLGHPCTEQLADRSVEDYAAAQPDVAPAISVRGHDDRRPDRSPEGR